MGSATAKPIIISLRVYSAELHSCLLTETTKANKLLFKDLIIKYRLKF